MGLLDRLRGRPDAQPLPPPTYSNDSVIGRIVEEEGVDRTTARAWFDEMLTFLDLYRGSAGVDPMIWAIPAGGTPEGTGGSTEPSGGVGVQGVSWLGPGVL